MDQIQKPKPSSLTASRQPNATIARPMSKAPVAQLLAKDVNRKEFLKLLSFGGLAIVGIAPLIHFLTGKNNTTIRHLYSTEGSVTSYNRGRYNK